MLFYHFSYNKCKQSHLNSLWIAEEADVCKSVFTPIYHSNLLVHRYHYELKTELTKVYCEPKKLQAPCWPGSSVGRALHRYRKGHGFNSRASLNLFLRLHFHYCFSSVHNREDHSSFIHSRAIYIFTIFLYSQSVVCIFFHSICCLFKGDLLLWEHQQRETEFEWNVWYTRKSKGRFHIPTKYEMWLGDHCARGKYCQA